MIVLALVDLAEPGNIKNRKSSVHLGCLVSHSGRIKDRNDTVRKSENIH